MLGRGSSGDNMGKRKRRDPAMVDVFRMKPRGKRGPKVIVYRDKRGRFIEVMKLDKDVELTTKNGKKRK